MWDNRKAFAVVPLFALVGELMERNEKISNIRSKIVITGEKEGNV